MKTLLLIPLFLFSFLFAQTDDSTKWTLGFQLGAGHAFRTMEVLENNITPEVIDLWESYSPITGLNGGITLGRKLTNHFWLETGIQVNRLGKQLRLDYPSTSPGEDPIIGVTGNLKTHFYYINLPLLAKLYLNKGNLRGFLFLGPQLNFNIARRQISGKWAERGMFEPRVIPIENTDNRIYNSTILSLVGGGGITYSLSERVNLEARILAQRDLRPYRKYLFEFQHYYLAGNVGLSFNLKNRAEEEETE